MSHIGQNIKKIRTLKKLSQADFAKLFNLARPSVGAYEEGRSEPKIDTLINIAKYFSLSIDLLLTKDLTVGDLLHLGTFKDKLDRAHRKGQNGGNAGNIEPIDLVRISDQLEYIVNNDNKDFLRGLPKVSWPQQGDEEYRIFEVKGSEMEFNKRGLHHADLVLARKVKKPKAGKLVIIVSNDEILLRRLKKIESSKLLLQTDDPHYPESELGKHNIKEIWEVSSKFSNHLDIPESIEDKVLKMEKQLEELASKLTGKS